MDYETAKHILLMHGSGTWDHSGEPTAQTDGFLGGLRPYSGLQEKNFHIVMEALLVVGEALHQSPQVDRDLVLSLWEMCSLVRRWGIHPKGMLPRNNLITPGDAERLEKWVDVIESTAWGLLRGLAPYEEVERYAEYITHAGWWDNIDFFIPLMHRAISDDTHPDPSVIAEALGKLGAKAQFTLPELYRAAERRYSCYAPEDRCTEEVRGIVRRAIRDIEAAAD